MNNLSVLTISLMPFRIRDFDKNLLAVVCGKKYIVIGSGTQCSVLGQWGGSIDFSDKYWN